ncbi:MULTISPECIES: urease accessory UreF family protein [unclassified Brevibacterium]|uniref:urease accessory protein UreF n=1 Tax=unclassified Brevibacterium TaxID=2614124 RepID=UPI001E36AB38|nr:MULTISPECIES: urease accessory UreF family protein [unclassified Brevibacterium]MCD1286556.1 urease accessory protein UreF [Brevibacterium sp. CCUG 69071]MDK8434213.1 urease accessory UreF family protein [Brevibacterium sp. H-BE7]
MIVSSSVAPARRNASATLAMLLADSRLPAGAHVSSNGLEAGLRRGLAASEVADYMRARMTTVVRVEAGAAVIARHLAAAHPDAVMDHLDVLEAEWAARTPSPALREIALALGAGLARIGQVIWPQTAEVLRPRPMPRPIVLGIIAACAGIGPDDLVRLVAYDDAQTVAAAVLKLEPTDPIHVTSWVLDACATLEGSVSELSKLTSPEALPASGAPLIEDWAEVQSVLPRRLFRA